MMENPFDDIGGEINNIKKKTDRKALSDEGFFMSGRTFQNKMTNVALHLDKDPNTRGLFQLNEWLHRVEYTRTPIWDATIRAGKAVDDNDEIMIKAYLAKEYKYEPTSNLINEALFVVASRKKIHPVKEYLDGLKWDGKPRIDTWLPLVCDADKNAYTNLVGRKLLCALVRRIYEPGCKFDNLVVLEGKEGIYKSTMLNLLGGQWYAPFSIKADSKDAVDIMQGKWLLEMEELATMRITDIEHVDAFLSRTVDRVRLSYRRNAQDFPRQCVLVGTMNPLGDNQYLKKQSENRRFWPIECGKIINIDWVRKHRDQLFAETMTCYKKEQLFLDKNEAIEISIKHLEERRRRDAWIDIINAYLDNRNIVTVTELLSQCLHLQYDKISHAHMCRVGICMRQLQWLPKRYGDTQARYYVRPGVSWEDQKDFIQKVDWGKEEE